MLLTFVEYFVYAITFVVVAVYWMLPTEQRLRRYLCLLIVSVGLIVIFSIKLYRQSF